MIIRTATGAGLADGAGPFTTPPRRLFLLGDNRDNWADRRISSDNGGVGMVPVELVIGRVVFGSWEHAR